MSEQSSGLKIFYVLLKALSILQMRTMPALWMPEQLLIFLFRIIQWKYLLVEELNP